MQAKTFALLATAVIAGAANAQAVRSEKTCCWNFASQIATHSVAACAANGYAVTATVVDRAGQVRAAARRQRRPAPWRPAA